MTWVLSGSAVTFAYSQKSGSPASYAACPSPTSTFIPTANWLLSSTTRFVVVIVVSAVIVDWFHVSGDSMRMKSQLSARFSRAPSDTSRMFDEVMWIPPAFWSDGSLRWIVHAPGTTTVPPPKPAT